MKLKVVKDIEVLEQELEWFSDGEWLQKYPEPKRPIEPGELLWPNSKGKHLGVIGPVLVVGVSSHPRRYDVIHRGELLNWSARQLEYHTKLSENVP
jgi:hypothetical protein